MPPVFVEEVPVCEVRAGIMHITWPGMEIALPVSACEKWIAKCNRELDRWHEGHGVVRFPRSPHG